MAKTTFNQFLRTVKDHTYPNRIAKRLDPETMRGRVFDLSQKQLVRCDGFELFVLPNDYVSAPIISTKTHEPHVTKAVRSALRSDDVFLDLGANVGYFTMLASSLVPAGKVISFEPNNQNLQLIYESILHSAAKNIEVYPFAVSDAKKLLHFETVGSNGGVVTGRSGARKAPYQCSSGKYHFIVQSVVLDEVLKDEARIDLIKMDLEAHEPFALSGMTKLIKKHKPSILTEFHPWLMRLNNSGDPLDYLRQIEDFGYSLSIIKFDGDIIAAQTPEAIMAYRDSLDSETIHLDLVATPRAN